jgi:signal transduction histidine kinase
MLRMFANQAAMAIESSEQGALLRSAHDRRRRLLQRVVEAAESERRRIAAELHDGPIQRLSVQTISMETAKCLLASGDLGAATRLLDGAQEAVGDEISKLRGLMTDLRPPVLDERGLPAALNFLAHVTQSRYGLAVQVHDATDGDLGMDRESEIVVYRVAQEAIANAAKHAAASAIEVELGRGPTSVRLRVRDDGRGFDPGDVQVEDGHFGLITMRERVDMVGGALEIRSAPGDGTEIVATIPTPSPLVADVVEADT